MTATTGSSIAILGLWHQGVVAAACLADLGLDVLAADHDREKIRKLSRGEAPLFEPGLDDLLKKSIPTGRLKFTDDVAGAVAGRPYVFIMFDTPVDDNDQTDLGEVRATAAEIAPNLANEAVILVTAQVPVGTCDELARIIGEKRPGGRVRIAYSPENLRLGQALALYRKPALPVLGADDPETLDRLEQPLSVLGVGWQRVSLRTAEMTKHALNAFLATTVTFGNELGNLCDEAGADAKRVAEVLRLEPRIGSKAMLFPGLGFSGGTLARDLQSLRNLGDRSGLETCLLDGVWEANRRQNELVCRKLTRRLGSLRDAPIAILGLTYKPGTSTLRRSAALEIIADLIRAGACIRAHDPRADRAELAGHPEFCFCEDVYEAVEGCRAAVIITGWDEYKALDFRHIKQRMKEAVVLDTNNMLDRETLQGLGFVYLDVGRGRPS